jgi:hypothetical protein
LKATVDRKGELSLMTLKNFIENLQKYKANDVYNPWSDTDPIYDVKDSAAIKTKQLTRYLEQRIPKAKYIMIAEALGFQGGRFSGIAMTSERIMIGKHDEINRELVYTPCDGQRSSDENCVKLTPIQRKNGFTEPTATIVWKTIMESHVSPYDIILWNIFPFHPFDSSKGLLSNRTPRSDELSMGIVYLNDLIKLLPNATLISVGLQSTTTLNIYKIDSLPVRHPANGGQPDFRREILKILV